MRAARILLASFLGYAALEGLIFHSGLYASFLSPDSAAGSVERILYNERQRTLDGPNQVLAVGNSRMGLFPRLANELRSETGYTFATIATPATTPRCWYYMLRYVDPHADRYAALVIGLDDYDDAEVLENLADRDLDTRLLSARLGLSDVVEYGGSFETLEHWWLAMRGILFRGTVYSQDIQEFLKNPSARLAYVNLSRRESHLWYYDTVGSQNTMEGVTIDWAARTMTVPPDRSAEQKRAYEAVLLDPLPADGGHRSEYMHRWLEKIYEHYRGSKTHVVFLRLPRGPLVRPDPAPVRPNSSVRQLASRKEVLLFDEHLFDALEQPALFVDALHVNEPGMEQLSHIAAREVRRVLGPAR